jgi:RNase H-fold protein (predicted Holliday junction resolvase)
MSVKSSVTVPIGRWCIQNLLVSGQKTHILTLIPTRMRHYQFEQLVFGFPFFKTGTIRAENQKVRDKTYPILAPKTRE